MTYNIADTVEELMGTDHHRERNLVKLSTYARQKGVSFAAIHGAIRDKRIIPTIIGEDGSLFIDNTLYKELEFRTRKPNRKKVKKSK